MISIFVFLISSFAQSGDKVNILQAENNAIKELKSTSDSVIISNRISSKMEDKVFKRFGMATFGMGYDVESKSVLGKVSFLDLSFGIPQLGGLGFGTSGYIDLGVRGRAIKSWFPLYTYYPIFLTTKENKSDIKSMLSVFAGGSYWCSTKAGQDGFSKESTQCAKNYINFGINYLFTNFDLDEGLYGNGNIAIEAGILSYQIASKRINSFYISLVLCGGAFAEIF